MKAKIKFGCPDPEIIDLVDFGYDKNTSWDDLNDSEQMEIINGCLEKDPWVTASGESFE
jgi:hypothetical protein